MNGRSLQATSSGIEKANIALKGLRLNQTQLAKRLGVTRQPVSKFFNGKSVNNDLFVQICETLELDWQEVCGITAKSEYPAKSSNIDQNSLDIESLVQKIRDCIRPVIQEKCGTMRVLDMTHPIGLRDIYTDVNILETVTGRRRLAINELLENFDPDLENFERRGLCNITEKRVPGLDVVNWHHKLMVLGKPGAGKTTFLKYLAIQCIQGNFRSNQIPIFITLKDFAENSHQRSFLNFVNQIFANYDITSYQVSFILKHGRCLFLLDGLDEVREEDSKWVTEQIEDFSSKYFYGQEFEFDRQLFLKERKIKLNELENNWSLD